MKEGGAGDGFRLWSAIGADCGGNGCRGPFWLAEQERRLKGGPVAAPLDPRNKAKAEPRRSSGRRWRDVEACVTLTRAPEECVSES